MWRKHFVVLQGRPCIFFRIGRAAMSEQTFGWRKLYEAAILEIVPDKLAIRIGGRAGHRSTRITCGYYRTRASQVGGCPFNAQDPEQDFHAVRGNTFQARSELCFRERSAGACLLLVLRAIPPTIIAHGFSAAIS